MPRRLRLSADPLEELVLEVRRYRCLPVLVQQMGEQVRDILVEIGPRRLQGGLGKAPVPQNAFLLQAQAHDSQVGGARRAGLAPLGSHDPGSETSGQDVVAAVQLVLVPLHVGDALGQDRAGVELREPLAELPELADRGRRQLHTRQSAENDATTLVPRVISL